MPLIPSGTTPSYQIHITKKIPQNEADVFALLQLAAPSTPAASRSGKPNIDVWAGRRIDTGLVPSDIQVDPRVRIESSSSSSGDEVSKAQTFNNEGKYLWDVSVAVPIKKISELKFNSTNNVVTPSQTGTQNAFAIFDWYLVPVDLAKTSYNLVPHPIIGVAMASQPLHKILFGGAIGLHYAEIYAGALFVKQQSLTDLSIGSTASPQQVAAATRSKFGTQFSVGINLPVRAVVNAVTKSTK